MKNLILLILSPLLIASCSTKSSQTNIPGGSQPNIILIMADDLGYGDLACYGSSSIKTPNIDRLADKGMKFTDFHSNGMVCSPTRAALLTGKYQQRTGLSEVIAVRWHNGIGLNTEEETFAEILNSAGYKTAIFGKWHLGVEPEFNPTRQGFDEFIGFTAGNVDYHSHLNLKRELDWWKMEKLADEPGYQTEIITRHAINYIKEADEQPFFLYLPFGAPHTPNQGPYSKVERTPAGLSKAHQKNYADSINATIPNPPKAYQLPEDENEQFKQISIEMVEYLDASIGRIIDQLVESNLANNTLVIFTSDNGPRKMLSAGPFRGGKGSLYEGGHHLPCIAVWPTKIEPGSISNETIMSMDFLPTFAALSGASIPENLHIDGIDLSDHLLNKKVLPERYCYWGKSTGQAIRDGDWKLIRYENENIELFNLAEDINESNNLAEANPDKVSQLSLELEKWYDEVTKGVPQIIHHNELRNRHQEVN